MVQLLRTWLLAHNMVTINNYFQAIMSSKGWWIMYRDSSTLQKLCFLLGSSTIWNIWSIHPNILTLVKCHLYRPANWLQPVLEFERVLVRISFDPISSCKIWCSYLLRTGSIFWPLQVWDPIIIPFWTVCFNKSIIHLLKTMLHCSFQNRVGFRGC